MIHSLSISYCGGCNAGYDRVAFVEQVLEKARQAGIEPTMVNQEEAADMAIVMAGCQALCVADREDMGGKTARRFVIGPDTLNAQKMPMDAIVDTLVKEMQG